MDEILHHLKNHGMFIPLYIPTDGGVALQASNSKCWPNARVAALTRAVADGAASCGCLCFCHASCLSYPSCLSWGKLGLGDPQIGGVPFRCPLKSLFWDLLGRLQALVSVFISALFLVSQYSLQSGLCRICFFVGQFHTFWGRAHKMRDWPKKNNPGKPRPTKTRDCPPKNKKQACGVFYLKFY